MGPWSVSACGWEPVPARLQQAPLARGLGTRPAWALRPHATSGTAWRPGSRRGLGSPPTAQRALAPRHPAAGAAGPGRQSGAGPRQQEEEERSPTLPGRGGAGAPPLAAFLAVLSASLCPCVPACGHGRCGGVHAVPGGEPGGHQGRAGAVFSWAQGPPPAASSRSHRGPALLRASVSLPAPCEDVGQLRGMGCRPRPRCLHPGSLGRLASVAAVSLRNTRSLSFLLPGVLGRVHRGTPCWVTGAPGQGRHPL